MIHIPAMKQNNYTRYFRVFQNDTAITEISTNNFLKANSKPSGPLELLPLGQFFHGYKSRKLAVEGAKKGARAYINKLIALGDSGKELLLQYRSDHYEDTLTLERLT